MTTSRLEFKVYNELASQREVIGQASVDLFEVMQKHRFKSMWQKLAILYCIRNLCYPFSVYARIVFVCC